jgi:hypothetical protein
MYEKFTYSFVIFTYIPVFMVAGMLSALKSKCNSFKTNSTAWYGRLDSLAGIT